MRTSKLPPALRLIVLAAVAGVYLLFRAFEGDVEAPVSRADRETAAQSPTTGSTGVSPKLLRAIEQQQSRVWVESAAEVTRILRDDEYGDRHQRFLVDVEGNSVLIAHNIDLAERVPVEVGDEIVVHGRFEWNEKGGVLHWTHHDPDGSTPGGWIEHRGLRYR